MSDLSALERETLAAIESAPDENTLETARVAALGKKGSISALLATLGKLAPDERKAQGAAINTLKDQVTEALTARRAVLKRAALETQLKREALDVTLPVPLPGVETGRIHPISQVMDEITAIFSEMGFSVAEGPDIESDDYNFTKLNFPPGHPAREMHDTFFLEPDDKGERKVLRTHTSPVQVRTMLTQKPPIRVICPGRTYRRDADQTHTPMFHQIEGLVVDQSSTLANLKWVLEEFCKAFFEVPHVGMRFRPSFFPFTSPSLEVDIQARIGSKSSAAAWSIPTCLRIAASTRRSIRASPGASGSTDLRCSNTACRICATSSMRTCAGSITTASSRSTSRRSPGD
jgi:phenylalanyl-tRNA synthetase alpha chain